MLVEVVLTVNRLVCLINTDYRSGEIWPLAQELIFFSSLISNLEAFYLNGLGTKRYKPSEQIFVCVPPPITGIEPVIFCLRVVSDSNGLPSCVEDGVERQAASLVYSEARFRRVVLYSATLRLAASPDYYLGFITMLINDLLSFYSHKF